MRSIESSQANGLVIEGGGSHTSIAQYIDGQLSFELHGPASNPRSVSDNEATDVLKDMLFQAQDTIADRFPVYAAHGAASTRHEARLLGEKIRTLLGSDLLTQVVVVNDIVPLALSRPTGNVFVAAAGTGTGYLARSKDGKWRRSSGYEFILADEGGSFDLGQRALRATTKDIDGRGGSTLLTELTMERLGCKREQLQERLFDHIYERDENIKHKVSTFADLVFEADEHGDEVAHNLLDDAAAEIALGIESLERLLGSPSEDCSLILTGSLLTAQRNLRDRVLERHGLGTRFDVAILGSMSLLQTTARLMSLNDTVLGELENSPGIPVYIWKGGES